MDKSLDPEVAQELDAKVAWRLSDGRVLSVYQMTYGKGRICIGDDLEYSNSW